MSKYEKTKGLIEYEFIDLIKGKYKGKSLGAAFPDIPYEFLAYEDVKEPFEIRP